MTTSVETPVGFADGKVVRIEMIGAKVLVVVEAWNETVIEVEFDDVIGIKESMAHELSDLVVTHSSSEFSTWCTRRAYDHENVGDESTYQFLDTDGQVCIEIVAKTVTIRTKQK